VADEGLASSSANSSPELDVVGQVVLRQHVAELVVLELQLREQLGQFAGAQGDDVWASTAWSGTGDW
jgi:hypothetical protein